MVVASNLPEKLSDKLMPLTERELQYKVKRTEGMTAERAFEEAFQNDPDYADFFSELPTKPRERAIALRWAARKLDNRPEMKLLQNKINEKLTELAPVALDTMEQIMIESKSDKVRADIAIEIIRQQIGSPDKGGDNNVNVQVVIGKDPNLGVIDGEIVDDRY